MKFYLQHCYSKYHKILKSKKLIDFDKKEVLAHGTTQYSFVIDQEDLKFVGANGQLILEPGIWDIYIGNLSTAIEIKP